MKLSLLNPHAPATPAACLWPFIHQGVSFQKIKTRAGRRLPGLYGRIQPRSVHRKTSIQFTPSNLQKSLQRTFTTGSHVPVLLGPAPNLTLISLNGCFTSDWCEGNGHSEGIFEFTPFPGLTTGSTLLTPRSVSEPQLSSVRGGS